MVDVTGNGGPEPDAPRLRRLRPERDGPDRGLSPAAAPGAEPPPPVDVEPPSAAATQPPTAETGPPRDVPEVVAEAVRLGYRVVEENLCQGRYAADRLRAGDYKLGDATKDLRVVSERVVNLMRELGSSWFDLLAAAMDSPTLREAMRSRQPGSAGPRRAEPPAGAPPAAGTPVEVRGCQKATGEANLNSLAGIKGPPQVTPLRAVAGGAGAPEILGCRLGARSDTGALCVIVPVPPDQPPGTYAGTVHEAGSQRLLGSVVLTVTP